MGVGRAGLFCVLLGVSTGLGAATAGAKAPKAPPKAPTVTEPRRLFEAIARAPGGPQAKEDLARLRALADKGDREAAALVAAQLYPEAVNEAFPYVLRSFGKAAPLPREVLLVHGLRCTGGFDERTAQAAAEARAQAPEADADERAINLIVLGLLSQYGGGGITVSKEKALDYFRQAAALGSPFALTLQGRIYEFDGGTQVPVDKQKALDLYQQAAAQQDPFGLARLADMRKEAGDEGEWARLTRRAAELGNESAMADYGEWLVRKGDKKSIEEGTQWLAGGMQLHGVWPRSRFALLLEEGKIPGVEAGKIWQLHRQTLAYPCSNPDSAEGMARLLPRMERESAATLAALSAQGLAGLGHETLIRGASFKSVRQQVATWLAASTSLSAKETFGLRMALADAALQYDARETMLPPGPYVDALFGPIATLLVDRGLTIDNLDAVTGGLDTALQRNAALSTEERAGIASAARAKLAAANDTVRARAAAQEREIEEAVWRSMHDTNPNYLTKEEFSWCMTAADEMEAMQERYDSRKSSLEFSGEALETQRAMYRSAPSELGRQLLNRSVDAYNESLAEVRELGREIDNAIDRFDDRCGSPHIAIGPMRERLCAGRDDNPFCDPAAWKD